MRFAAIPSPSLNQFSLIRRPFLPFLVLALTLVSSTSAAEQPALTQDHASNTLNTSALGPVTDPYSMRAGGFLVRHPDGFRRAPTVATEVDIQVTGLIARTKLIQRFHNSTTDWVEGIYVFPLPDRAAVDSLEMRIGDRVIEGQIQERAEAKATYKKAKREGRKASLVEQERPNIFTISVAHLGPDEEIEIALSYQEDVRYDQGEFSLRFPMVVAPRYIPGTQGVNGFPGSGWATNTDQVPDAQRITPPALSAAAEQENRVSLRARLDIGFPLERLVSTSHAIRTELREDESYEVLPRGTSLLADSDFVLRWTPLVGETPRAALFREEWEGAQYALLMVLPPNPEKAQRARLSREMIIVIDTSGSMSGESIVQAKKAVAHALSRLQPEDTFNVIQFSSTTTSLFSEARPAEKKALGEAKAWVTQLKADGGTEMLPAIEAALRPGSTSRAVRQVIFVTDGAVGHETMLFAAITKQLGKTRLYSVGIGSAPNSHFMTKAAQFGRGTFTYIADPGQVEDQMNGLFAKLDHPVLHDLEVDWGTNHIEAWPARIPDVYLGEPVVIAARLPDTNGRVTLRGRREGELVRIDLGLAGGSEQAGIARIWARRKVAHLMDSLSEGADLGQVSSEVATIGVRHHLVTRWTSLVAVDLTPTAPLNMESESRAIPGQRPKGAGISQGFAQVGAQVGKLPQGATPFQLLLVLGTGLLTASGVLAQLKRR